MTAVEPNKANKREGQSLNGYLPIKRFAGSPEKTSMPDGCFDLVSMASSFHWADFLP
jgi:hypothetical protein